MNFKTNFSLVYILYSILLWVIFTLAIFWSNVWSKTIDSNWLVVLVCFIVSYYLEGRLLIQVKLIGNEIVFTYPLLFKNIKVNLNKVFVHHTWLSTNSFGVPVQLINFEFGKRSIFISELQVKNFEGLKTLVVKEKSQNIEINKKKKAEQRRALFYLLTIKVLFTIFVLILIVESIQLIPVIAIIMAFVIPDLVKLYQIVKYWIIKNN